MELSQQRRSRDRPPYGRALALWLLLGLFCLRVFGQLAAAYVEVPLLPTFEEWDSGALPYPLLVLTQFSIIGLYAAIAWRIGSGKARPNRRLGRALVGIGSVYFAVMLARLVLGATLLRGHWWLDMPIPSFFHLVLAAFLIVAGRFYSREGAVDGSVSAEEASTAD